MKPVAIDADLEVSKNHASRGNLKDDGIKPIHEQKLHIGRVAFDLYGFLELDLGRIGHHGRHCQSRLLESSFKCGANAAHTDIGIMREMDRFQASIAFRLRVHSIKSAFNSASFLVCASHPAASCAGSP